MRSSVVELRQGIKYVGTIFFYFTGFPIESVGSGWSAWSEQLDQRLSFELLGRLVTTGGERGERGSYIN